MSDIGRLFDLAKDLAKAEVDNWAGRVNVFGLAAIFLLVYLPTLAFDTLQVVARLWDDHYETELPSTLSIVRTFGFLLIACVAVLALAEAFRSNRKP